MEGWNVSNYAHPIPSLHGGISQQSALVRSPEQLESQINAWSSLADGLTKRAPTEHVTRLFETAPANAHIHKISRDGQERYLVVTANNTFRIFDLATGEEQPFEEIGNSLSYLSGVTDYRSEISLATMADYTFVVNRNSVCELGAIGDDLNDQANYFIHLNKTIGLDENGMPFAPGTAYQYPPNPTTSGVLSGTYQSLAALEKAVPTPVEGSVYKIQGDETSDFNSYYVRRSGGVWDEKCVKPGLINAIKAETMPHALVRGADGVFRFAPFSWAPRTCGDTETNANPGFIGRTIRKVVRYQNRLSFIYDENVVLSGASDFGNFWRTSQQDYLDSDVVDLGVASTGVCTLKDAVEGNDGMILTSDQNQFSLSQGELGLTAMSFAIRPTTNYVVNTRAGLTALGSEVYFAVENNGWANIREYTRLSGVDANTAADITAHVPRYIPAGVHALIAADEINALFVLTEGAKNKAFVYQFYWSSPDEKAQAAWHEWDFGVGSEVVSGAYLGGYLNLCIKRGGSLFLERVDLRSGAHPESSEHQVFIDRRHETTGTYVTAINRTELQLAYAPVQSRFRIVRGDAFGGQRHTLVDPTTYQWISPTKVSVPGAVLSGPLLYGEAYEMSFQFSTQFMQNAKGEAVQTGHLILRSWTVSFSDTAYFKTLVSPYGGDPIIGEVVPSKLSQFTGRTLGANSFHLNTPSLHTGSFRFMVGGKNTLATVKIANDTHAASTFVAAAWEGFYNGQSRV